MNKSNAPAARAEPVEVDRRLKPSRAAPSLHWQVSHGGAPNLVHSVPSAHQFRYNDSHDRDHRKTAVVELAIPPLLVILADAQRVAEVARFLRRVLRADGQLHCATRGDQRSKTIGPGGRHDGVDATRHEIKAWELDPVLHNGPEGCHHSNAAMLELG